ISSTPIRNIATVAGNFINASPIGDLSIFFLALDAQLVLSDGTNQREIPLRKLYLGYKKLDKKPEEYVERISFRLPEKTGSIHFEKVCKRTYLDIASVNSACFVDVKDGVITQAGISAGGVGPVPLFLPQSSRFLIGKRVSEELLEELLPMVQQEISPISDVRGTDQYKRRLLSQMVKGHFMTMFKELDVKKIMTLA
ncbi:MAG TPA: FAD binding domain-containing protein, partial [Catalimonadaceae bacterium]|nr:FAD binding domain-containing protein [Catalimonadaceae bacterium]